MKEAEAAEAAGGKMMREAEKTIAKERKWRGDEIEEAMAKS